MKRIKSLRWWAVALLVLLPTLTPLLSTMPAYAAVACTWKSATQVTCGNGYGDFTQTSINGTKMQLTLQAFLSKLNTNCNAVITLDPYTTTNSGTLTHGTLGGCPDTKPSQQISINAFSTVSNPTPPPPPPGTPPPPPTGITCDWVSATQVTCGSNVYTTTGPITGTVATLTAPPGPSCPSNSKLTIPNYTNGTSGTLQCGTGIIPVTITTTFNQGKNGTGVNGGAGSQTPSCENNGLGFAWFLCPLIEGLAKAVDGTYHYLVAPLLVVTPIDVNGSNSKDQEHTYEVWSNFRIYGDIFLIIALLVIVYGQSLGGGLVDAYTAKKVLPRLVVAAIAINLSIYIVAFAVDVTNILGGGIQNLLEGPFQGAQGNWSGQLGGAANGGWAFNLGGVGGQFGSGITLAALVGGTIWAVSTGGLLYFLFVFVLLPAIFVFVAILATVLIRQALIIFLVFTAPVAFALYCLPNTEQYFHRWWKLLVEALMVYPIIAIIFALSNILSVVVLNLGNQIIKPFAILLSIIALIAPLVLIPYAFRLAGGAIGKMHDVLTDYGKRGHQAILGNPNDPNSMRNRARFGLAAGQLRGRRRIINWGQSAATAPTDNRPTRFAKRLRRGVGRAADFGNIQARESLYNKQEADRQQAQTDTGNDANLRDVLIGYDRQKNKWYRRMDMNMDPAGNLSAMDGAAPVYQDYATGAYAHKKALRLNTKNGNTHGFQGALYYEWKKTSFSPHAEQAIGQQYGDILKDVGLTNEEGQSALKAIGFRHQDNSLSTKYSSWKEVYDADGRKTGRREMVRDPIGMSKETALNKGTGHLTQQDVETFTTYADSYRDISQLINDNAGQGDNFIPVQADASGRLDPALVPVQQYEKKTLGQLKEAQDRLRRIAFNVNPNQTVDAGQPVPGYSPLTTPTPPPATPTPGTPPAPVLAPTAPGAPAAPGGGIPQAPYGGVSYAPVDPQQAARHFYEVVASVDRGGGGVTGVVTPRPRSGP